MLILHGIYDHGKIDINEKELPDIKTEVEIKLLEMPFDFIINRQVILEFCNIAIKKLHYTKEIIEIALEDFKRNFFISEIDQNLTLEALKINNKYGFSYYDSLIIASALNDNCIKLFTEDMQNGQIIENKLTIKDPFF